MAATAEKNYVKESKKFNGTVYTWHFYRLPMKLREGNVFTGVFHSVWGSYVATTHDALDFSELPLLQTWDLTVQRPFKTGTSLYKDPPVQWWHMVAIEAHVASTIRQYASYWNAFLFTDAETWADREQRCTKHEFLNFSNCYCLSKLQILMVI